MPNSEKIRWGILSTGKIASRLAKTLGNLEGAELLAVGSRSRAAAEAFGQEYAIPRCYGSYEELAADPDVDVIYVASPHSHHLVHTELALDHGKHVLCEKAFCHNALEARRMVEKAKAKGLFLMDAMWSRFLPHMVRLRELLAERAIGELYLIRANMGFKAEVGPEHRLVNPELAGGALLDIGIYPLSFISMIWGKPLQMSSQVWMGPTGVDLQETILLDHGQGRFATVLDSFLAHSDVSACLYGSSGYIEMPRGWFYGGTLVVHRGQETEQIHLPYQGGGDQFQAMETMRCIRAGRLESEIMPLSETVAIMETMDALRAQWGLRYPGELR